MSKIYVWSMKSSLHTNYRFRGTMKKLAIQIKREFAEKAYDACLALIYQDPTADVEIAKQNYINTNYPL